MHHDEQTDGNLSGFMSRLRSDDTRDIGREEKRKKREMKVQLFNVITIVNVKNKSHTKKAEITVDKFWS